MLRKLFALVLVCVFAVSASGCGQRDEFVTTTSDDKKSSVEIGRSSPEELINEVIQCLQNGGDYSQIADCFNWSASAAAYMIQYDNFTQGKDKALAIANDMDKGVEYLKKNHRSFTDWWFDVYGSEPTDSAVASNYIVHYDSDYLKYYAGLDFQYLIAYMLIADGKESRSNAFRISENAESCAEYLWDDDLYETVIQMIRYAGNTRTSTNIQKPESLDDFKALLSELYGDESYMATQMIKGYAAAYPDGFKENYNEDNLEKWWQSEYGEDFPALEGFYSYNIDVSEDAHIKINFYEQDGKYIAFSVSTWM